VSAFLQTHPTAAAPIAYHCAALPTIRPASPTLSRHDLKTHIGGAHSTAREDGRRAAHELERAQGAFCLCRVLLLSSPPTAPRSVCVSMACTHLYIQPQGELIYESVDLSQFRGKRLLVDAASFVFWVMEDVMGKQVRSCVWRVIGRPLDSTRSINQPISRSVRQSIDSTSIVR
jgi:hypothetical protein